jgi:type VI secretion system protein ImpC
MRSGTVTEIDRLPLHVYVNDGESDSKPCAEILITEDAVERLLEEGLIPLVSFRHRELVRIVRMQSISAPPRALAGPWAT